MLMEDIVGIHVRLLDAQSNNPIVGDEYKVLFYDKDPLKDDFLGQSTLDDNGHALISISRDDIRSRDTPFEKYPDLYFKLEKDGKTIFTSPVSKNVQLEERNDYPASEARHCNLGIYTI